MATGVINFFIIISFLVKKNTLIYEVKVRGKESAGLVQQFNYMSKQVILISSDER